LDQYKTFYGGPHSSDFYFRFLDDFQIYSASLIIEDQWQHITSSDDGLKTFIEIFDDMF